MGESQLDEHGRPEPPLAGTEAETLLRLQQPLSSTPWAQDRPVGEDSGDALRALWAASVQRSRAAVTAARADGGLDGTHPAWGGQGHPPLRRVLLHVVEEDARRCGHTDLLRGSLDGETGE